MGQTALPAGLVELADEPDTAGKVYRVLDGAAFLAVEPGCGEPYDAAAACGPSGIDCLNTATVDRRIRRRLHCVEPSEGFGGQRLGLSDFVSEARDSAPVRAFVEARGALSDEEYAVPVGVVSLAEDRVLLAEPSLLGAACADDESAITSATANILARDIVRRWWQQPETHRPQHLDLLAEVLPNRVVSTLLAQDLRVHGYTWSVDGAGIVLVAITSADNHAASYGVAVTTSTSAVVRAFCQAVHARVALQWRDYPGPVSRAELGRLAAAWHQGPEHLGLLEQHAKPSDDVPTGYQEPDDWLDHAARRFGHEPVVVRLPEPDGHSVVKVLCPGAAVYRRAAEALSCPVW